MRANNLPSILSPDDPNTSAISMERALKQIRELLEEYWTVMENGPEVNRLHASIDDVDTMLSCIKRED